MKGLLIDPELQRVEEVDLPTPNGRNDDKVLERVYEVLGIALGSRLIQGVQLLDLDVPYGDTLYVDEEGRLRPHTVARGSFALGTWSDTQLAMFVGRGLVLRVNERGNWVTPRIRRNELMKQLTWIPA